MNRKRQSPKRTTSVLALALIVLCFLNILPTFAADAGSFRRTTDSQTAPSEQGRQPAGKWLADDFSDPPARYRMMKLLYGFDQNYPATIDRLTREYGYGGVTTNVNFNEEYLRSDAEFALLDDAFAQCMTQGMAQLWLYDEYQWPSGSAYGMVTRDNPEYAPCGLAMLTCKGSGATQYNLPEAYAAIRYAVLTVGDSETPAEFTDRSVSIDVPGAWELKVWATCSAWVERDSLNDWQKGKPYINIMSGDAVTKFLSLTHEAYKHKLTRSFGNVEAFFTDEPSLFTSNMTNPIHTGGTLDENLVPWEDSLPAVFREMHGYDVFDHLPSLYGGDSTEDRTVRIHYYQTVAEMIAENYFGQISRWCGENGLNSSGHLLLEEKLAYHVALYGDLLRCMNAMDYPGCDLLQVSPQRLMDSGAWVGSYAGIKMASSSARNTGKAHVLAEFNPAAVEDESFRSDPLGTSLAGAAITRMYGADKFVMLNPQESYRAEEARALNESVGRLNVLLEGAVMNSGIGVYYPIATVQGLTKADTLYEGDAAAISEGFNELCLGLLTAGYDYNYVDDSAILSGTVSDGALRCGSASYRVIVMAYAEAMDPAVMDKLEAFRKAGGAVLWVDSLPAYAAVTGADAALAEKAQTFSDQIVRTGNGRENENLTASLAGVIRYGYRIRTGEGILYSPYERDGKQLIVAVNTTPKKKTFTADFGAGQSFCVYDPSDGGIVSRIGNRLLTLDGYHAVVLVCDHAAAPEINKDYKLISAGGRLQRLCQKLVIRFLVFFRRIVDCFARFSG